MLSVTSLILSLLIAGGHQEPLATLPLAVGRPCTNNDLVGTWQSVRLPIDGRPSGQIPSMIEYLRFSESGEFIYVAGQSRERQHDEVERILTATNAVDGVTFTAEVSDPGLLLIARDGVIGEGFTCTMVAGDNQRDEMVWSELLGKAPSRRRSVRFE